MASNAAAVSSAIDPATMNSRRCHVILGRQQHAIDLEYLGSYSGSSTRTIGSRSLAVCSSQQLSSIASSSMSTGSTPVPQYRNAPISILCLFVDTYLGRTVAFIRLQKVGDYLGPTLMWGQRLEVGLHAVPH